jgi:protein-S-isoprenylcysteine O-methyltransferase Ste14
MTVLRIRHPSLSCVLILVCGPARAVCAWVGAGGVLWRGLACEA